ncbi:MAG: hypothetical protein AAB478_04375 [Patescibacteria group bacterium]
MGRRQEKRFWIINTTFFLPVRKPVYPEGKITPSDTGLVSDEDQTTSYE